MKLSSRTIRRRAFARVADEKGQAAIELLLAFPFFLIIVLLAVDFGILMYHYVSVANAAREGARYGAVGCPGLPAGTPCDSTAVSNRTIARSSGILQNTNPPSNITVSWRDRGIGSATAANRGDSVVVRVQHTYSFLFIPFNFGVASCADMRLEQANSSATIGGSDC